MTDKMTAEDRIRNLATFGADLSRWPEHQVTAARAALLADPAFRRAWDAERALDAALAAHRDNIDRDIARAGATERVAQRVLARLPAAAFDSLPWRRVAAAMVVAGALGGAMSLVLPDQAAEASDVAAVDPLLSWDDTAL